MSLAITAVATAVVGTAYSIYSGERNARAQASAVAQSEANASRTAALADQANNAANQKRPDTSSILSAASQAGRAGVSGTMLTGPTGVDPNSLTLGKSTLLGT